MSRVLLRCQNIWRDPPGRFEPGLVAVTEDRIEHVAGFDAEAPAIDLGARFLLPGLVNTHVHLEFSASTLPLAEYLAETPEERLLRAAGNAHRMLMSGATTVRDCGSGWSMLALARRPDLAPAPLPRLVCCGPPITVPQGHLHMMGGECTDATDALAHIDRGAGAGARSVKVMASGGNMTPGTLPEQATFSLEILQSIALEARRRALPSVAHVLATESIRRAALAGFGSLEHCAFLERDGGGALVRVFAPEVARIVAERGAFVMANLSTATRALDRIRAAGSPDPAQAHQLRQFDRMLENFGRLAALGIPITAGTDAGVRDTPFEDTWLEIEWMVRAGLPAIEALRAATTHGAAAVGLGDRVGRVAPGFAADLIATGTDPLRDAAALANIDFLMADGVILKGA